MGSIGTTPYGRRLFPTHLDEIARTNPGRVYAAIPKTADVKDGFLDVTIGDIARCANFMARWIEDKFGKSRNFETIGSLDYQTSELFLESPRNPTATNVALLEQTGCTKVLYSSELALLIEPYRSIAPSSHSFDEVPSFLEMLHSSPDHYPYDKSFDEAKDDPILVIHSSGSTGLPRPIQYTHGTFAAHDREHLLPAPAGRKKRDISFFEFREEARIYVPSAFFHLSGFVFYTFHTIFNTANIVIGPPHIPPHVGLIVDIAQQQNLRGIMVPPAIMEQLLQEPTGMDIYNHLEFVVHGGAPLSPEIGALLAPVVNLMEFYGSSETFPLPELFKDPADFHYHEFNPNLKFEMQLYDADEGTYEFVLFAKEADIDTVPLCHNYPGVEVYHTKDLFTRHPTKENLWKYFGRTDDIIVLATGDKNQTALIVEPKQSLDATAREDLLQTLWPHIEQSNASLPGKVRVAQDKIICTTPDRPFARTGKVTIMRGPSEKLYQQELEAIYS
ncbi:hypothetical protein LQW54_012344 [Pestalotiopsis sp. IQ-011]